MIKLVHKYNLELASTPFGPEDGKVYFVSTEVNRAADRFVEDNLEELRDAFSREGLEFIFVQVKIGKDVNGRDVPPTVFSYADSKKTDKGIAFSAYHLDLDKDRTGEALLLQLYDVARVYSRTTGSGTRSHVDKDPETAKLLDDFERCAEVAQKYIFVR